MIEINRNAQYKIGGCLPLFSFAMHMYKSPRDKNGNRIILSLQKTFLKGIETEYTENPFILLYWESMALTFTRKVCEKLRTTYFTRAFYICPI